MCLVVLTGFTLSKDRKAAREAFQKAVEYHDWLKERPKEKRTNSQYKRSIYFYRLVVDNDPTFGGSDDSIYAMATLYDEMAERYDSDYYRRRAIYYYEFVAKEYPLTKHKSVALKRADELAHPKPNSPPPNKAAQAKANPDNLATLSEVRYWSNEDYTRVVLQLDREVKFEKSILSNPDRIYFDLDSTYASDELIGKRYAVNGLFITQLRVAENRPGVIRVVLDFEKINQHTVFALYDPFRIVIDTRGPTRQVASKSPDGETESAPSGQPSDPSSSTPSIPGAGAPPAPTANGDWTLTRTLGLKVGKVVIDPGHGGKDTGTIGPTGLKEKDLVLSVALKLRDLLEERLNTEVILTREDDRFIPLEERTAIANQEGADLFISVHANASRNRRASGIETYVLSFATSDAEREVASRENASSQRNIRELEDLLKKIAMEDFNQESRDLAHAVQTELFSELSDERPRQKNRGIKQAPFIVLIGSNMPSILTEIGFISNPDDEKYYRNADAQNQVAEALYKGLESYFRSLGTLPATGAVSAASGR